jgi:hypothetical protein
MLGLTVLRSSVRGGGRVFDIDLLAADGAGQPWIIECKHDRVDPSAARQVMRYREAFANGWRTIFHLFNGADPKRAPEPGLALVGYRFSGRVGGEDCVRLAYRYHDIQFRNAGHEEQRPARVSIIHADRDLLFADAHPKVCKRFATTKRLQTRAPQVEDAFWRIAEFAEGLHGVTVFYGGKNFVRFSNSQRVFAEAVVEDHAVKWRIGHD